MKKTLRSIFIIGFSLGITSGTGQAATVSFSDPVPGEGISYEWTVNMNSTDSATLTNSVGAKSWNEPLNPVGLKGWTHTSNWVALELLEDSALTLTIDRAIDVPIPQPIGGIAGNNLYPAFSVYSGWQDGGEEDHAYNNSGNTSWADEIDFLANNSNSSGGVSISQTLYLAAGKYSLAIGGNPSDPNAAGRQGYTATLQTSPASIPEPSTNSSIGVVAALMLLSYCYRKSR